MKTQNLEDYLKNLRSDPTHAALIKKVPQEERKKVINLVEYITSTLFESMTLAMSAAASDPEISQQLTEALKDGNGIIKESDGSPIVSTEKPEEK